MSAPTNDTWIAEEALAERLGVDRDQIKKERPYAPTGGVRVNGKTIEWSMAAAEALALQLGLPCPGLEKNAAPTALAAQDDAEELTVVSSPTANGRHFANPNLIRCRRPGGELVLVRVLDSAKYQPTLWNSTEPMKVRARKSKAGTWWELVSREPRWRGRW